LQTPGFACVKINTHITCPWGKEDYLLDVLEKVKEIISDQLDMDLDEMDPATKLSSLDIDSLDLVEIVMAVEDEFGITISEEDANRIEDLDSLVGLVKEKL